MFFIILALILVLINKNKLPFYAPPPPPQFYYNQSRPAMLEPTRDDLNSRPTRQQGSLTSEPKNERPITVNEEDAEVEIPSQELQPFELLEESENFFDSDKSELK